MVSNNISSDSPNANETSLITDRVEAGIRSLILSGELPPGSRIGQEDLAARFSVSRIPVRVALGRLESDGLVVLKANSGAWVARVDLAECLEIYMIRERLEPLALAQSIPNMSEARLEILERLRLKDDHRGGQMQFRALLRELADNRLVAEMHAIEVPDGRDAAAMPGLQIVQTADELHVNVSLPERRLE